jgi:hypothetical protein
MKPRTKLVIAAVFLIAALLFPIYTIITSLNEDLQYYVISNPLDDTARQNLINERTTRHNTLLTIVLVVDTILVALFAVSLWAAMKP